MHVELIYSPGCNSVESTLQVLETIIAEERLPIPVEVRKDRRKECPQKNVNDLMITVDGTDVSDLHQSINCDRCRRYQEHTGINRALCMEHLREVLWQKWRELTEHPMMAAHRARRARHV
jgi:hypothetical protein